MSFLVFIITTIVTNIFFSFALCAYLMKLKKRGDIPALDMIVYFLGLGPGFTVILLGYLLQILPEKTPLFYVSFITLFYTVLLVSGRKQLREIYSGVKNLANIKGDVSRNTVFTISIFAILITHWLITAGHVPIYKYVLILILLHATFLILSKENLKRVYSELKSFIKENKRFSKNALLTIILLGIFTIHWLFITWQVPVYKHDMIHYGIQGKIFYQDRKLQYKPNLYDEKSRFSYRGRHGFSFPLFLTWEMLFTNIFNFEQDLYFRSIPGYYWALIVIVFYLWLSKQSKTIAFIGTLILITTLGFFRTSISHNIDTFRIFYLITALIFALYSIEKPHWFNIINFGIFGGIAMNAHSIGVVLITIFLGAFAIFMKDSLKNRIIKIITAGLLILMFGGIHYILDIFLGTGWIFTRLPA